MSHTLKLVLLLLTAFVVLGLYALLADKPTFFGWAPKQVSLRSIVTDTIPLSKPAGEEKKDSVKTPATKQRILLIGDSMTGLLCYPLAQFAVANGHTLDCMTWTSATIRLWDESPRLDSLMKAVKPTYVMICLGSNELYSHDMESIEKHTRSLLKKIGNVPVLWIGPPNWCEDGGINDLLLKIMGKGCYYPSKNLTLKRRSDGRHPTRDAAGLWMDAVVEWMKKGNATHPVLFNKPAGQKTELNLTVLSPKGDATILQRRDETPAVKATQPAAKETQIAGVSKKQTQVAGVGKTHK